MQFGSPDGRQDSKNNGIGFVEISKIVASQGTFFFGNRLMWQSLVSDSINHWFFFNQMQSYVLEYPILVNNNLVAYLSWSQKNES